MSQWEDNMPNWVQLVQHTAEFSGGNWTLREISERGGDGYVLLAPGYCAPGCAIATVHPNGIMETASSQPGAARWNPEGEANARLLLDAPEALMLLARVANLFDGVRVFGPTLAEQQDALIADVCTLIRRHVRLGCAPVDAESRAQQPGVHLGDDVGDYTDPPRE